MISSMNFTDRVTELSQAKQSVLVLGVDPQLDSPQAPGVPTDYSLNRFCSEIIEACADQVVAVKFQLAFFEARGLDGMRALAEAMAFTRRLDLPVIADAKRGDIGSTSAAYAEAFLGRGNFASDAMTINPYLGADAIAPFLPYVESGRGLFVLVKTSNPSSGDFQDLPAPHRPLWELVAEQVHKWGEPFVGEAGLSSVGAVIGATYPAHAERARILMPRALILVPGYGAQGASAADALAAASDAPAPGVVVNASRAIMYAYRNDTSRKPPEAARRAAQAMRAELALALAQREG
jgi:orotidine-5'-phosphate decarboxylase